MFVGHYGVSFAAARSPATAIAPSDLDALFPVPFMQMPYHEP